MKPGSDGAAYWEPAIDTEVDRMRREGLCLLSPKSPEQIVTELQEVTRGPMMYPSSVCESVPFQMAAGLDEAEDRTYRAEAIITVAAPDREAFAEFMDGVRRSREEPPTKPRSKRGQRQRRWR